MNKDNNNVLSMRDYLEAKNKEETFYCGNGPGVKVIQDFLKMASKLDKQNKAKQQDEIEHLSMSSIEEAIHYEYRAQCEVLVTFESKDSLFKVLKTMGLGDLLRVKYCNLENPVIKEFFELLKKED